MENDLWAALNTGQASPWNCRASTFERVFLELMLGTKG